MNIYKEIKKILYHGSNVIVETPKIIKTEYSRDFGFGFYTTDIKEQAVRWAIRKAKLAQRKGLPFTPYILIYKFDEDNYILSIWRRKRLYL